jgi:hypothetical protein
MMAEWKLWQRILGWIRAALNTANAAGAIPQKKPDSGLDDGKTGPK